MNDDENSATIAEIVEILRRDIHREFRRAFEDAHYVTFELPLQSCNEIRNAVDHLGQALWSQNRLDARIHLENSRGHITLASAHCVAIAVLRRIEMISDCIQGLEEDQQLVLADLRLHLVRIQQASNALLPQIKPISKRANGRLISDQNARQIVLQNLKGVFADCNRLFINLRSRFETEDLIRARARGLWVREGRPHGAQERNWAQAKEEFPVPDD